MLSLLPLFAIANECPEDRVCPATYPVRSDPGSETCNTPEADAIRDDVVEGVAEAIASVKTRLNDVLRRKYPGSLRYPAISCAEIKEALPESESDWYYVSDASGVARQVYCDLSDELASVCGNSTGWRRVFRLNMTDPNQNCPGTEFGLQVLGGQRVCFKGDHGCSTVSFPIDSINYQRVCGRVIGYQIGSTDAFLNNDNIDDVYIDGVSLTYGSGPRNHIWSFASYLSDSFSGCPCNSDNVPENDPLPSFITEEDYFCESGTSSTSIGPDELFGDDPLWDGQDCNNGEVPCCRPPWFVKQLPATTNSDIELRLCNSQPGEEQGSFQVVDIYVQQ